MIDGCPSSLVLFKFESDDFWQCKLKKQHFMNLLISLGFKIVSQGHNFYRFSKTLELEEQTVTCNLDLQAGGIMLSAREALSDSCNSLILSDLLKIKDSLEDYPITVIGESHFLVSNLKLQ